MSFDVSLSCPCCERTAFSMNLTHNVNGIVDICLREAGAAHGLDDPGLVAVPGRASSYDDYSWGRLAGHKASALIGILQMAHRTACDPRRRAEFECLAPENGWGTLESVRRTLKDLVDACENHPELIVETDG
jgi:hypothetical protein